MPKSHFDFWKEKFEKNVKRDKIKIKHLKKEKWRVLTLWECQIKKTSLEFVEKISMILNKS